MPDVSTQQPVSEIEQLLVGFWRFDHQFQRMALFGVLTALLTTESSMREDLIFLGGIYTLRTLETVNQQTQNQTKNAAA